MKKLLILLTAMIYLLSASTFAESSRSNDILQLIPGAKTHDNTQISYTSPAKTTSYPKKHKKRQTAHKRHSYKHHSQTFRAQL